LNLVINNPINSSQRNLIKLSCNQLSKISLLKQKIKGYKNCCGKGRKKSVVAKRKGGGVKKNLRQIDFCKSLDSTGLVVSLEYDPTRTSYVVAIFDFLKYQYFYKIAPENLQIGDVIQSGKYATLKLGNTLKFDKIPVGTLVHNLIINKKSKISKAAGCFSLIFSKTIKHAGIQTSSGKKRYFSLNSFATLGVVSNKLHFLKTLGKAGRARWLNKKQSVRGVAKNPVDHYNGGGEGKKSGVSRKKWRTKVGQNKNLLTINSS